MRTLLFLTLTSLCLRKSRAVNVSFVFNVTNGPSTWEECAAVCSAFDPPFSSFATIINAAEQTAAAAAVTADTWIAATDQTKEGNFSWSPSHNCFIWQNGHGVIGKHAPFAKSEPNDDGDQDCVQLWVGKEKQWDDDQCTTEKHCLCKIP